MFAHLRRSVVATFVLIVITFAYSFLGTGLSQLFFHHQANGSMTAYGSPLIGQDWSATTCPRSTPGTCVFHGRPDDTGPYAAVVCGSNTQKCTASSGGDNPLMADGVSGSSGASNLGPRSQTLLTNTETLVKYWNSMGVNPTPDLVTTSGSGYDPDISPQDATVQIPMVAKATGLPSTRLAALIKQYTHPAQWGFLGSSWIDVLSLNEGLTALEHLMQ